MQLSLDEQKAEDDALVLNQPAPAPVPIVTADRCYNERFIQPPAIISRKIDLLFVADTSGSLDEERLGIADGIDAFVGQLPAAVDFRIGVMLAHSSKSSYSGSLYRSVTSEPYTLASDSMALADIRTHLHNKLVNIRTDNYADGGEEGLYSLTKGLSDAKLAESRARGFFREDAALAIVFISDEQDICFDYPADITPVFDTDRIEPVAKARDCAGITPQSVVDKLKSVQGERPLLVSGLIYIDNESHPHQGENEKGYGWLDTIRLGNGLAIDLANGHYNEGLAEIGRMATVTLALNREFVLEHTPPDTASVQAKVDGIPVPSAFDVASNKVTLTESLGGALSAIDITYCEKPLPMKVSELCSSGGFIPKPVMKVGLSNDPAEGSITTILRGFTALGITPVQYTDAQIAAGQPMADGVNVLAISRKVVLNPVSDEYVAGIRNYVAAGGSIIGEFDGAALFFSAFSGSQAAIMHMNPSFQLFTGDVAGGGALLPLEQSRAYITDPYHPITEGMPSSFLQGVRSAFAITNYDGEWLHQSAQYISIGYQDQVPEGTYPAVLSGRCGGGRVVLFPMTHFTVMSQDPFKRMMSNSLKWVTGVTN